MPELVVEVDFELQSFEKLYTQIFLPEIYWKKDGEGIFFAYFVLLEMTDLAFEAWPHV